LTKQDTIELYQALLASGDVPNDIRARYNYNTVSGVLSDVCKSIFALDANFGDQMAKQIPLDLAFDKGRYYCLLDVFPLNGSQGIRAIISEDGGTTYFGRQGATDDIIAGSLGGVSTPQWTLSGDRVVWNKKGASWVVGDEPTTFTARIVVDIDDMDDDDFFVAEEYSEMLLNKVVGYIRQNDVRPSEKINDTKQDNS
jgi:hypothetical protein